MEVTNESFKSLIDTCENCAKTCTANAAECKGIAGMEDCYHVSRNCAQACEKVISELKDKRKYLANALDKCAHICEECSKECAKYNNSHCRECSEICLKCTEICSSILGEEQVFKL